MNILFHSNQLCERGTETALFDYALGNENILHNKSYIIIPEGKIISKERYENWKKKLPVLTYSSKIELQKIINEYKIDLIYEIESGNQHNNNFDSIICPVFVHAVFTTEEKHGDYYVPIHSFLNKKFNTNYPVLPHICKKNYTTNEDMRIELSIPSDAIVFGCIGGAKSFSIDFVKKTVIKVGKNYPDIFFVFMNIENFVPIEDCLKNIIFLPGSTDLIVKEKFMNTCNAMLHARLEGETFGLAVAEFAMKNKPVITYREKIHGIKDFYKKYLLRTHSVYDTAHISNLGKTGIYYFDAASLEKILVPFKQCKHNKNYDVFSERFSEKNVMYIFDKIIKGRLRNAGRLPFLSKTIQRCSSLLLRIYRRVQKAIHRQKFQK